MSQHITMYTPAAWAGMAVQPGGVFVRGAVTAACLSAFQDCRLPASMQEGKRVLRHALQGGTALAAGTHAAAAWCQRDYTRVLLAVATGAASVLLIEQLLRNTQQPSQENLHV